MFFCLFAISLLCKSENEFEREGKEEEELNYGFGLEGCLEVEGSENCLI